MMVGWFDGNVTDDGQTHLPVLADGNDANYFIMGGGWVAQLGCISVQDGGEQNIIGKPPTRS